MAAKHERTGAPGIAHPTVVPANADDEERCPTCGSPVEED